MGTPRFGVALSFHNCNPVARVSAPLVDNVSKTRAAEMRRAPSVTRRETYRMAQPATAHTGASLKTASVHGANSGVAIAKPVASLAS